MKKTALVFTFFSCATIFSMEEKKSKLDQSLEQTVGSIKVYEKNKKNNQNRPTRVNSPSINIPARNDTSNMYFESPCGSANSSSSPVEKYNPNSMRPALKQDDRTTWNNCP